MDDAEGLRNRASRLLALALKAHESGMPERADELTKLAADTMAHAEELERRPATPPPPKIGIERHVTQQQQQPQPGPGDKKE